LPVFRVSSRASSALRARNMSAALRSTRPRSTGISAAHSTCAALARATLASSSAGVVTGSDASVSPVAGLTGETVAGRAGRGSAEGGRLPM